MDPLAEERYWVTSYNYVQNNPLNRTDPTGTLDLENLDWFQNEKTGEVMYQKDLGKNDAQSLGDNWSWLGEDNMFGKSPNALFNSFNSVKNQSGESSSYGFSADDSNKFMSERGYKFADKQLLTYDKSANEKISAGPYSNTLITGELINIVEKRAYVPNNYVVCGERRDYLRDPKSYLSLSGHPGLINIYRSTLNYDTYKKKSFWQALFSLTENLSTDSRPTQYYSSWDKYPKGKNKTIDKYIP